MSISVNYQWTNTSAGSYPGPNAFGTVGVCQRVAGLLKGHGGGANVGDHDGPTIPAQRVLQITDKCAVGQQVSRPTRTKQQGAV